MQDTGLNRLDWSVIFSVREMELKFLEFFCQK